MSPVDVAANLDFRDYDWDEQRETEGRIICIVIWANSKLCNAQEGSSSAEMQILPSAKKKSIRSECNLVNRTVNVQPEKKE